MPTTAPPKSKLETLDIVLDGLMRRYKERVPDVGRLVEVMKAEGLIKQLEDIQNDHVAFRAMGVPNLGIASLEKIFLHYGYQRRERYDFAQKKLNAHWYHPPENHYPRIFISELRVQDLSPETQAIIHSYTDTVTSDPVDAINLDDGPAVDAFLHTGLWPTPTWSDYQALSRESEYAAWVIYNRYYLNHFTISVHTLPAGYNTLQEFNAFLEANDFTLNDSGGKIKVSDDELLLQSSTVSEMVDAEFADGEGGTETHRISGSYVEFAERRVHPEFAHLPASELKREHRRDGFEAANANKIFESTYSHQTQKRKA